LSAVADKSERPLSVILEQIVICAVDTENEVPLLGEGWFDPLETGVRQQIRSFIESMLEEELAAALGRERYDRNAGAVGRRNGHRERQLLGTFGPVNVSVPRARVADSDGKQVEWNSKTLPAYKRLTVQAERLIAGAYLAGVNTRRVRRALGALFGGAVGKDTVGRTWHKMQSDWEAWQKRSLAGDDIVRLILDGTVVRVCLDKKATSLSVLVALGVRRDGQKVLLALRNMGGESEAAWRALLDDLVARGLAMPELVIVDGAPGLEKVLAALWNDVPIQRCTVHKHRNLLAHAPKKLYDEITADYNDMIYAKTAQEVDAKRSSRTSFRGSAAGGDRRDWLVQVRCPCGWLAKGGARPQQHQHGRQEPTTLCRGRSAAQRGWGHGGTCSETLLEVHDSPLGFRCTGHGKAGGYGEVGRCGQRPRRLQDVGNHGHHPRLHGWKPSMRTIGRPTRRRPIRIAPSDRCDADRGCLDGSPSVRGMVGDLHRVSPHLRWPRPTRGRISGLCRARGKTVTAVTGSNSPDRRGPNREEPRGGADSHCRCSHFLPP
jgi:putative transposase